MTTLKGLYVLGYDKLRNICFLKFIFFLRTWTCITTNRPEKTGSAFFNLDLFFKHSMNRNSYIHLNLKCLMASISTQQSLTFIIEKSYGRYHETRKFRKCHKEKWQAFYYILSPKTVFSFFCSFLKFDALHYLELVKALLS